MFANVVRICGNRATREIFKDKFKRHISKTSSAPNNGFMSLKQCTRNPEEITSIRTGNNIRAFSTVNANTAASIALTWVSKDESREFMSVFQDIIRDLTDDDCYSDIPEITKRFAKVLQYNVPGGKKNRGLSIVAGYKMMESPKNLTSEKIRLANILGWCVEMKHASFLINDDIIDKSKTRRGLPCWYTNEDVGLEAVNDAVMIHCGLYLILRKYFSGHHCYFPTLELFNDVTMKTAMGQSLDARCLINGRPQLHCFTMNRYTAITKYKTACGSFQLPVTLSMYLTGIYDPEMHRQTERVLLELGHLFQARDDFLDCFGDPKITGKIGTDISGGKCTWLVVTALQRSSPAQKQILEDRYGKQDPESQAAVRHLYEELGLPNAYLAYEGERLNLISKYIQQIPKNLPHTLFFKLVEAYRRMC